MMAQKEDKNSNNPLTQSMINHSRKEKNKQSFNDKKLEIMKQGNDALVSICKTMDLGSWTDFRLFMDSEYEPANKREDVMTFIDDGGYIDKFTKLWR